MNDELKKLWSIYSSFRVHRSSFLRAVLAVVALSLAVLPAAQFHARGQNAARLRNDSRSNRAHESSRLVRSEAIERAMGAVCFERQSDPLGSVPIDVMQARPSLSLTHSEVIAGAQRAKRLLPIAKRFTVSALRELAGRHKISASRVRAAVLRIKAAKDIEPDIELRDNAAVILSNPYTISFGTIFLAGLPSDEAMISVLAHELVHIADGKRDTLYPLFRPIGRSAASLTGLRISGRRSEELTCDLVGTIVARAYIARIPNDEPLARRLARSVQHNCVEEDDTDEEHLSPRNTMRALLALDPALARDVMTGNNSLPAPLQSSHYNRRAPHASLTMPLPASYHHRFK